MNYRVYEIVEKLIDNLDYSLDELKETEIEALIEDYNIDLKGLTRKNKKCLHELLVLLTEWKEINQKK